MTLLTVNKWIGTATNGNWYTATNWSLGRVPTTTDVATIEVNGTSLNIAFGNQNPTVGGISLQAINGANLTLSGLTEYPISAVQDTNITATASRINFPNLTKIVGSENPFSLIVNASNRGEINLDNVTSIDGGTTEFVADGLGSVIRLSSLQKFLDTGFDRSLLKVKNAGVIELENITELEEVDLVSDNSFLSLPRFTGYVGDNAIETLNGGQIQVDALKTIKGRILQVRAIGSNSKVLISNELVLNTDYLVDARNGGQVLVEGNGNTLNYPPLVNQPIPAQNTLEDQNFSFTIGSNTFADIDSNNTLTYSATLANGKALPSWLSFNTNTRTFSGTPTNDNVGIVNITVKATDSAGASATTNFGLTIVNVNDAPTISNPIPDQSSTVTEAFNYTFPVNTFSDVDAGDLLTYTATLENGQALPSWLAFNANNRTFSGTPPRTALGSLAVKVTASDRAAATVTDTFNLAIADKNLPPTLGTPLEDQSTQEDENFRFTIPANTFTDLNVNDVLTYSVGVLPSWLTFAPLSQTFTGKPTNDDVGQENITVTATDASGESISDTFSLTVLNVNDAPTVVKPLTDHTDTVNLNYRYQIPENTFDDVDAGDSLSYGVKLFNGGNLPPWLSFNPNTRTLQGTPTSQNLGALNLQVTATDESNASVTESFTLTVFNTFDVNQYGASYSDLITAIGFNTQELTQHYINNGRFENRPPDLFDEYEYLASNVDLIEVFGDDGELAAQHYIQSGFGENRSLNSFDAARYIASYPDLTQIFGGSNPNLSGGSQHYVEFGRDEQRQADSFQPSQYIASYDDLINAFGYKPEEGTLHYLRHGYGENRQVDLFKPDIYIASYPDLITSLKYDLEAGDRHYIEVGSKTGLGRGNFDPIAYLDNYADLQQAFGSDYTAATRHYIESGFAEGRVWS